MAGREREDVGKLDRVRGDVICNRLLQLMALLPSISSIEQADRPLMVVTRQKRNG